MSAATAEPLLRARGLRLERGRRTVLAGIDLELRRGEVVAVLGPNGAGKSTLLEALAGLIKPSAGEIVTCGRVVAALQSPDLARRSVSANVALALSWAGVARGERAARIEGALAAVAATDLADRRADALSGGERRRVHLARALAVAPDVLLLDEPFAGLDTATRGDLLADTTVALRRADAATLVVVHDRAEAWALADRLIVLLDGVVAADGDPRALLDDPPTPEVAMFLGFDGVIEHADHRLLTRAAHVVIDPEGDLAGTVVKLIPTVDGARVAVQTDAGTLHALTDVPGPAIGDPVRLRITGGVRFPRPH